jgi:integrative and conjugative element protein (TIGR02256 family)
VLQKLSNGNWSWKISPEMRGSFPSTFIQDITHWRQHGWFSREAGGLALGYIDIETGGLLAEKLTLPGRGDKRSRTSFFRGPRHQVEAAEWHCSTGARGTMLGLWHTHPESIPHPSDTDWADLSNVLDHGTYNGPGLVYLIVGTEQIGCWFGQRAGSVHQMGHIPI